MNRKNKIMINRVYTRTGDKGQTSLLDQRLSKSALRIHAIGELDELNAWLGMVVAAINEDKLEEVKAIISIIQNKLFDIGAMLAVVRKKETGFSLNDITFLEHHLDQMNTTLPSLTSFVLPGGHEIAARLHLARTYCRSVERTLVALDENETIPHNIIPYINRLSDWLFVAARFANLQFQQEELLWQPSNK